MRTLLFLSIYTFALSIVGGTAFAAVPKLINYQGKLTSADGFSLADGEYSLRFELFDKTDSGQPEDTRIWGETRAVTLVGGIFNVALGGAGSTPVAGAAVNDIGFAFTASERYLQTTIVAGPEITEEQVLAPRQQMASVPYALESGRTRSVSDSSITRASLHPLERIPAGAVQMFHSFGGTLLLPRGWMILNGDAVNQANYDAIHGAGAYAVDGVAGSSLLSKNLPDMDARYATGVDATTQDGSSAITAVGNSGNAVDLRHSHGSGSLYGALQGTGHGSLIWRETSTPTWVAQKARSGVITTAGSETLSTGLDVGGSTEFGLSASQSIRPDSVQFIFIIKVM